MQVKPSDFITYFLGKKTGFPNAINIFIATSRMHEKCSELDFTEGMNLTWAHLLHQIIRYATIENFKLCLKVVSGYWSQKSFYCVKFTNSLITSTWWIVRIRYFGITSHFDWRNHAIHFYWGNDDTSIFIPRHCVKEGSLQSRMQSSYLKRHVSLPERLQCKVAGNWIWYLTAMKEY